MGSSNEERVDNELEGLRWVPLTATKRRKVLGKIQDSRGDFVNWKGSFWGTEGVVYLVALLHRYRSRLSPRPVQSSEVWAFLMYLLSTAPLWSAGNNCSIFQRSTNRAGRRRRVSRVQNTAVIFLQLHGNAKWAPAMRGGR